MPLPQSTLLPPYRRDRQRLGGPPPNQRKKRRSYALWWGIALTMMLFAATISWTGSAYVFGHPEVPIHYHFLKKIDRLPPPNRFTVFDVPRGQALTATEVYSKYRAFLQIKPADRNELNRRLLREYIQNYHRSGPVDYVSGAFRVMEVRELTKDDFMPVGLVVRARSVDIEDLEIEYLMPGMAADPASFRTGDELTIESTTAYAAVLRMEPLGQTRICIALVPLVYGRHSTPDGLRYELRPPESLNPGSAWPLTGRNDG